jgi:dTDP-4-dehydrorhamnose reductase
VRVLITGATGLLGATLVSVLESSGIDVCRHGRRDGDIKSELTDRQAVKALLERSRPDTVVNLAALTNVDECERFPQQAYLANTRVVENLVAALAESGDRKHLVQISTDQLYDGTGPHQEGAIALGNYYAFSKYAGELAAAGTSSTILRTNFFGRSRCSSRSSFSDWIVGALRRGETVKVFEDVYFSPLSLERLASLICHVLERPVPGVFNLGSREGMSKAEFCYSLARVLGLPAGPMIRARSTDVELRAYRPKDMRMDCSRFEQSFGVQLPTLQQEIDSMKGSYDVET